MEAGTIFTLVRRELAISIRNKWTAIFALVFAVLITAISYFGSMTSGAAGFQGFNRTSASLLSLVLYLVPLVSLMMATQSFAGGAAENEILFSQPISRSEVLLGKVLGLFASMSAATLAGFGLGGLVIATQADTDDIWGYPIFVALSLVLSLVFLTLAALVSMIGRRQTKAFGLALLIWFFFVIFYDLLVLGGSLLLHEKAANYFIFASLFGNPVDMVRVAGLISLQGQEIFGPAGAALVKFLGGESFGVAALIASLFAWIALPLLLSLRLLKRQDI